MRIKELMSSGYIMKKVVVLSITFFILIAVSLVLSYNLHMVFTGGEIVLFDPKLHIMSLSNSKIRQFFGLFSVASLLFIFYLVFAQYYMNMASGRQRITPKVSIPAAAGEGQYGTAKFATSKDIEKDFQSIKIKDITSLNCNNAFNAAGIYLGTNKNGTEAYCMSDDTHALVIGSTGSGKTRCLVLQTITTLAMAGESMIVSDPKSELYLYSKELLEQQGYSTITLDFIQFSKSNQYNFLQPVIDAVNKNDMPLAITRTNDLVAALVQSDRTNEPIWTDGERSVIACAIMAVVYDNRKSPQYQTLTNVYYFLANMCKPGPMGSVPLSNYVISLPEGHPAKAMVAISEMAPSKMRGSFYASALTTLQLFTSPDIYSITHMTDFDMYSLMQKKTAIFIILPDYKQTYYNIATLFVSQQYQIMRDEAYQYGGRMPVRMNFVMDEFGNFAKIPDFTKHITVGRGCGIRYMLFLQAFEQLKKVYGDEDAKIIRSNTEIWVYLKSLNYDTLKEISDRLGNYTIKSQSYSANSSGGSASYNYTGRNLLMPNELEEIERPYQIVFYRGKNYVMYSPDISKTVFNELLGMGTKEHNLALFNKRNSERRQHDPTTEIPIWKIWERPFYSSR